MQIDATKCVVARVWLNTVFRHSSTATCSLSLLLLLRIAHAPSTTPAICLDRCLLSGTIDLRASFNSSVYVVA